MTTTKQQFQEIHDKLVDIQKSLNNVQPLEVGDNLFDFYRLVNNISIAKDHTEQILKN